jgi:2-oxoglutarate ferredoxin oxidoreductase subunit gamma
MHQIKQALLCGVGGQGIVLAGTLLGRAAFNDGKWVSGANSYGSAARGGLCQAGVVISNTPIIFPHIIEADVLIAMYQSAYRRYISKVKREGAVVIYDGGFVSPEKIAGIEYVSLPATKTAIKEFNGETFANVIILSAAVAITGLVTEDALKSAITEIVPERLREMDLRAVVTGFELGNRKVSG